MRLTAELFEEIVRVLKCDAPAGREKRVAPRVGVRYQVTVVLCPLDDVGYKITTAALRNMSPAGIGLLYSADLSRDTEFILVLPRRNGQSLAVLCKVVFCEEVATSLFSIGSTILRTLPPADPLLTNLGPLLQLAGLDKRT